MSFDGTSEAIVLVKAAPHISTRYGETVCCAGITLDHSWVRLYPVQFRHLDIAQQFGRWDRIRFGWRSPRDDSRPESKRLLHDSIDIIGKLKPRERTNFLKPNIVTSLRNELEAGRTLALLRPQGVKFSWRRRRADEVNAENQKLENFRAQPDLLNSTPIIARESCPFEFRFEYETDDGKSKHACGDWETDAMFLKFRNLYGEEKTLDLMAEIFGERYPQEGVCFAMGTHSRRPNQWLLVGVVRVDDDPQLPLL